MALDLITLKKRMREAFGNESQETIGSRLGMTQGNVSKLLSGNQQPTLETVYHVAQVYDVSVDWLLGLSDKKNVSNSFAESSYAEVTQAIYELVIHGGAKFDTKDGEKVIKLSDPLLIQLLEKSLMIMKTDRELFSSWVDTRLSQFGDRELISSMAWSGNGMEFWVAEAVTEANWLEVHDRAREQEETLKEMFKDDVGPFGG